MPEMVEIEIYRKHAERLVGRTVEAVDANDAWFCKRSTTPALLVGTLLKRTIIAVRRIGKLLLLDMVLDLRLGLGSPIFDSHRVLSLGSHPTSHLAKEFVGEVCESDVVVLGLRFGMTGRLVVDGVAGIEELLYSSGRNDSAWDRFGLRFTDGTSMSIRDPRRLGGVELDPDTTLLGVDALVITIKELRVLTKRVAPIKSILLDQSFIAGLGNLLVDEVLWRCGLAPNRPGTSIADAELRVLHKTIGITVRTMLARGGSHLGDMIEERHINGKCPMDGAAMIKGTFGGRRSWWCPHHQV